MSRFSFGDNPLSQALRACTISASTPAAVTAAAAGVDRLIVHARKAWLRGLSPRENRNLPPLDYARVYRLEERLPALDVVVNGGVATLEEAGAHLAKLDGVMMGTSDSAAFSR